PANERSQAHQAERDDNLALAQAHAQRLITMPEQFREMDGPVVFERLRETMAKLTVAQLHELREDLGSKGAWLGNTKKDMIDRLAARFAASLGMAAPDHGRKSP